eukprot:579-Amphidinium_carterae.1
MLYDQVNLMNCIQTLTDQAANYSGFDADEEAKHVIRSYHDKRYLEEFSDLDQVERILGSRPVISRFGVITK